MKDKTTIANSRLEKRGFPIPTPDEVMKAQSGHEAWTALQIAEWGY